jgi:hypothetical protein
MAVTSMLRGLSRIRDIEQVFFVTGHKSKGIIEIMRLTYTHTCFNAREVVLRQFTVAAHMSLGVETFLGLQHTEAYECYLRHLVIWASCHDLCGSLRLSLLSRY